MEDTTKNLLIQSSTTDGIIRLLDNDNRTNNTYSISDDPLDTDYIEKTYFKTQKHDNFISFLGKYCFQMQSQNYDGNEMPYDNTLIQITTHSKLIYSREIQTLKSKYTDMYVKTQSLLEFDTQQQFIQRLREFFQLSDHEKKLLIIQCECGNFYQDLITCARFTINDEYNRYLAEESKSQTNKSRFHIILIIQIPKIAGGCFSGFQILNWYNNNNKKLMNLSLYFRSIVLLTLNFSYFKVLLSHRRNSGPYKNRKL